MIYQLSKNTFFFTNVYNNKGMILLLTLLITFSKIHLNIKRQDPLMCLLKKSIFMSLTRKK